MVASLETRIRRAVKRLVKAEIAHSWRGGGDPADLPATAQELALARKRFNEVVKSIESTIQRAKNSTF